MLFRKITWCKLDKFLSTIIRMIKITLIRQQCITILFKAPFINCFQHLVGLVKFWISKNYLVKKSGLPYWGACFDFIRTPITNPYLLSDFDVSSIIHMGFWMAKTILNHKIENKCCIRYTSPKLSKVKDCFKWKRIACSMVPIPFLSKTHFAQNCNSFIEVICFYKIKQSII